MAPCPTLTANRDIHPGDIISIDYEQTEEDLVEMGGAFDCKCAAANCRGRIVGWKYRQTTPLITIEKNVINEHVLQVKHFSTSTSAAAAATPS